MNKNIFYAQSGGVTAVINATACGVIQSAAKHSNQIGVVYAGRNGILGALQEELIDTSRESAATIAALRYTPGGAFGSCRYKLQDPQSNFAEFQRLIDVFSAHNIGYFFYNGGGDSQDTTLKVAEFAKSVGYPLTCIGLPKTIDNDLAHTDNCPGFGSVAKYVATSIREAGLDVASMAKTSSKIFVLEVMGRHAGWIAAAGGLAAEEVGDAPHIILFPEVRLNEKTFLLKVENTVKRFGYCALVVSEGVRWEDETFVADSGVKDAFGHAQLGGVAPVIADLIKSQLGHKCHWAVADYLQRAARHIAAKNDVEQAYALGVAAVEKALAGEQSIMLTIERLSSQPYEWQIGQVDLSAVANIEKMLPKDFITSDGFGITDLCRQYLQPLIEGEDYPPYQHGLPQYARLQGILAEKKCLIEFPVT